ncbi:MAG: hypothetical protein JJT89_05520 [Nitriliruptoraceae bacterium]|nr:hypothetical protein [Nitriliruptoraceae bacterium]
MDTPARQRIALGGIGGLIAALLAFWRRRRRTCCDPEAGAWSGPPDFSDTGQMTNVDAFAAYVTEHDPCWRTQPIASALAVIGIDPTSADAQDPFTVQQGPSAGSGEVDVVLTFEVTDDDSVAGIRYQLTFVDGDFLDPTEPGFRLVAGLRQLRCQPGRGQQDWGTALCL